MPEQPAANVDELREALIAMRDLAMVAHNGDPYYAENEGIDVSAILEQARRVLGEEPILNECPEGCPTWPDCYGPGSCAHIPWPEDESNV